MGLHTTGNFPRHTLTHKLHVAFSIPYIHDFITKLCRQQADNIYNHENGCVCNIGTGKAHTESIRCLNMVVMRPTTMQLTKPPF